MIELLDSLKERAKDPFVSGYFYTKFLISPKLKFKEFDNNYISSILEESIISVDIPTIKLIENYNGTVDEIVDKNLILGFIEREGMINFNILWNWMSSLRQTQILKDFSADFYFWITDHSGKQIQLSCLIPNTYPICSSDLNIDLREVNTKIIKFSFCVTNIIINDEIEKKCYEFHNHGI